MRLITISFASLLSVFTGLSPLHADQLSQEQYELCSKSPLDSQCNGYQVPISLHDRPGEPGACVITANKVENRTVCKLVVNNEKIAIANNEKITVYYEVGEALQVIGDKKATREIQISPTAIKAIRYKEGTKDNSTARAVNTFLLGIGGFFGTSKKKVAEIAIDYTTPPPPESIPKTSAPKAETSELSSVIAALQAGTNTNTVVVVVRRKTGENLRLQLEQLTGLTAETPPTDKQPEAENKPSEQPPNRDGE